MQKFKNCSHVCAQLSYSAQSSSMIFPFILQKGTRAQMLSIGGEGKDSQVVDPHGVRSTAQCIVLVGQIWTSVE